MKKTYRFRCIDKLGEVRTTASIDADSDDEAQWKIENWCQEYLQGERVRIERIGE